MDLVATLRSKIDKLPNGDHATGLKSVLSHIEAAFRHLTRGQAENDESLFTDVIYRCNQAFEGSIKEAYRVLAGKDPQRKSPYQIETYLDENSIFRDRVMAQFTNYRTQWRNPSTHDYNLDFDESESFLAIVSVSAFACVLIDQIASRLAHDVAAREADQKHVTLKPGVDIENTCLMELATEIFIEFSRQHRDDSSIQTEIQLMGALTGFFSALVPKLDVTLDYRLSADSHERSDLLLRHDDHKVLVELKRTNSPRLLNDGITQLQSYMSMTGIKEAILFMYPPAGGELFREEHLVPEVDGRIIVLRSA